jgi:hypothetical protein
VRSVFVLALIETGFPLTIDAVRVLGVGFIGGGMLVRRWGIKIGLAFWIIFKLTKTAMDGKHSGTGPPKIQYSKPVSCANVRNR